MTWHTMLVDRDVLYLAFLGCILSGVAIGIWLTSWYYESRCPWCGFSVPEAPKQNESPTDRYGPHAGFYD